MNLRDALKMASIVTICIAMILVSESTITYAEKTAAQKIVKSVTEARILSMKYVRDYINGVDILVHKGQWVVRSLDSLPDGYRILWQERQAGVWLPTDALVYIDHVAEYSHIEAFQVEPLSISLQAKLTKAKVVSLARKEYGVDSGRPLIRSEKEVIIGDSGEQILVYKLTFRFYWDGQSGDPGQLYLTIDAKTGALIDKHSTE